MLICFVNLLRSRSGYGFASSTGRGTSPRCRFLPPNRALSLPWRRLHSRRRYARAAEIYRHFAELGIEYAQFIPCLPTKSEKGCSAAGWGRFLTDLFGEWVRSLGSGRSVGILYFDELFARLNGRPAGRCGMNGYCSIQNVIEADGTVYPCDFYCTDDYALGNIREMSLKELFECERAQTFLRRSFATEEECKKCPYYRLCRGGCFYERESGKNRYCVGYRIFFQYLSEFLKQQIDPDRLDPGAL